MYQNRYFLTFAVNIIDSPSTMLVMAHEDRGGKTGYLLLFSGEVTTESVINNKDFRNMSYRASGAILTATCEREHRYMVVEANKLIVKNKLSFNYY